MLQVVRPKPVIYLAGKIAKDDWRTKLFSSRFGAAPNDGTDSYGFDRLLDETLTVDCGNFRYGGPFFISCDHGCAHGPATHGATPNICTSTPLGGRLEIRADIWRVNCARIQRADFIFAYINETDCFGTFVELGFAAALNKQIGIGIGRSIKVEEFFDLWMVRQCHSITCAGAWLGSPQETFREFLTHAVPLAALTP